MARPRILPDADTLGTLRREGKTYQEIADRYGVSRAAVHVALTRSNLIETPRPRYDREIPWTVKVGFSNAYPLAMLRISARRNAGLAVRADKARYLDNWVSMLQAENAVVAYSPSKGFYYVARRDNIDTGLIRKPNWLIEDEVSEGLLPESALQQLAPVV